MIITTVLRDSKREEKSATTKYTFQAESLGIFVVVVEIEREIKIDCCGVHAREPNSYNCI
jgi:acyl carrier protein